MSTSKNGRTKRNPPRGDSASSAGRTEPRPEPADLPRLAQDLRRAETALRASEERIRTLFEQSPLGYQSLDAEGRFLDVNPAWLEMLGYAREDVIGKWFGDFLVPESADEFRERFPRFKAAGKVHTEFQMLHRDGRRRSIVFDGRIERHPDGSFRQTHCILSDVTERKQSEEQLRQSEAKRRRLFETMSEGVFYQRADGTPTDVNPAALRMFGLSREEFLNRTSLHSEWDVIREDGTPLPGPGHPSMQALRTGKPVRGLVVGIRNPKTQAYTWVSATGIPEFRDGESTPWQVVVTLHDLTERKRAEIALRESETRFRSLYENSLMGISMATPDGRLIQCNRAYANLYGYANPDEMLAQAPDVARRYAHPEDRQEVLQILSEKNQMAPREMEVVRRDGTVLTVLVSARAIRDAAGHLRYYQAEHVDLTERKRAELALRESEIRHKRSQQIARTGGWEYDLATDSFWGSDESRQIYALPQDGPFTPEQIESCIPERERVHQALVDLIEKDRKYDLEFEIHPMDGSAPRIISSVAECLRDSTGKALKVVGAIQDITERKRAELALAENERKYKQLFQSMTSGFALHEIVRDAKGIPCDYRFLQVNPAFERLTGLQAQDLIGKTVLAVLPQTEPIWIERYGQVVETGKPAAFENYSQALDRHYQVFAYRPEPEQFAVIVNDVSDRRRAEKALAESEARYRTILNTSPDGIVILDAAGRTLMVSPGTAPMFGFDKSRDLTGLQMGDFLAPQDRERAFAKMALTLQGEQHGPVEYKARRADGSLFDMEVNAEPIRDAEGQPVQLVAVIRDVTERKRAEETLRTSEERFRAIFDRSTVGKAVTAPDGKLLGVNAAFARMLGLSIEELQQVNFAEITHPDDLAQSQEAIRCLLANERPACRIEKRYRHKDGHFVWCDMSTTLLRDGQGAPLHFITSIQDISERKRAEEELRQRENLLQKIFDLLPVGLWFADKDGQLLRGNPAGVKIWGAEPHVAPADYGVFKARRLPSGEEIAPEDWALAHTIREGATIQNELLEIDAFDGVTRTILNSTAPVLDEQGAIQGAIVVNLDVTDLKQIEGALRASESKTRSILDNIGIGVALIGPNMEILELNRQMQQWFPAANPGQHPICYRAFNHPPREAICDYCPTAKTLRDGQVHEAQTQTPTPNGIRNYRLVSSPVCDQQGRVTAAIELVEDVTEKSALEIQLRQAQKMESVGRLAGGVAHDFNNMLGVILGHAEMALELDRGNAPLRNNLTEIRKAAERSADLTRQLLAFARKQTVAPKVVDLNRAIDGMLNMLRRLIGENIRLDWRPAPTLWPVWIDPSQIDQIVANLCVNARDAIAGIGTITIETAAVSVDDAACATRPGFVPGDFVRLAIQDTGSGMDAETLSHVFEPFFTTKGLGEGTGLGLATVYGNVKQNNGFVYVSSEPGQGTSFEIYLPRHADKTVPALQESGAPRAQRGDETILLVEDERSILELTAQMLEQQGYTVLAAVTPGEAIRLARDHSGGIDLLLTDVVMPEMNGRDLAKNVLAIYPELKRLFMSGYTADVIAHQGVLDAGVQFIQKPFTMQALTEKIRAALDAGNE